VVSREVYSRHVCILQIWSALSYFRLAVEFVALPRHVFASPLHAVAPVLPFHRLPLHVVAPALLAHLLLEGVVQDVKTLIPFLRTSCWSKVVVELECKTIFEDRSIGRDHLFIAEATRSDSWNGQPSHMHGPVVDFLPTEGFEPKVD